MMKLQSARIAPIVFFATLFVAVNVVHAVCPRGFIKGAASGRCILPVFSGRKSFAEAKLACASRGLRLMPFETEADKKDAVSACRGSNCWVDVQQTPSPWGNEYGWYTTGMDCSRVTLIAGAWTSTKAHESSMLSPVNRGTCGMVKVTALCDASCAEKYHYLCTDPCECPEGLIRGKSSSRCILPVPTRKTFEDAKADCHRRGLVLMPIPNADYLKDATATCRGGMCWVGVEQVKTQPAGSQPCQKWRLTEICLLSGRILCRLQYHLIAEPYVFYLLGIWDAIMAHGSDAMAHERSLFQMKVGIWKVAPYKWMCACGNCLLCQQLQSSSLVILRQELQLPSLVRNAVVITDMELKFFILRIGISSSFDVASSECICMLGFVRLGSSVCSRMQEINKISGEWWSEFNLGSLACLHKNSWGM